MGHVLEYELNVEVSLGDLSRLGRRPSLLLKRAVAVSPLPFTCLACRVNKLIVDSLAAGIVVREERVSEEELARFLAIPGNMVPRARD